MQTDLELCNIASKAIENHLGDLMMEGNSLPCESQDDMDEYCYTIALDKLIDMEIPIEKARKIAMNAACSQGEK